MRIIVAPVVLLLGAMTWTSVAQMTKRRLQEAAARTEGEQDAHRDLAADNPVLYCSRDESCSHPTYTGLDAGTGLPLRCTCGGCGVGARLAHIRERAYNRVMRAAERAGRLHPYDLRAKLRTPQGVAALFQQGRAVALSTPGDALGPAVYHGSSTIEIKRPGHAQTYLRLAFGARAATAPVMALLTDANSTLLLRDRSNITWTIDLASSHILQVTPHP